MAYHAIFLDAASAHCLETDRMPEIKNDFRQTLGAVIDLRSREVPRQTMHRRAHLLLGAVTSRPA